MHARHHVQLLSVVGILLTTVVYNAVYTALADGLAAQLVLSSPSAGRYNAWVSSLDANAPIIYTTFVVYNITNPTQVRTRHAYKRPHTTATAPPNTTPPPRPCHSAQVVSAGAKPNVEEVATLNYYYQQQKYNVTWCVARTHTRAHTRARARTNKHANTPRRPS